MIFRRKRKENNTTDHCPDIREKAENKIAVSLLRIQNGFASFMGKWVNALTTKGKKIFLIIFCLAFGGYSLTVIVNAFFNDDNSLNTLKPNNISVPKHLNQPGDETVSPDVKVTEKEYQKITGFKQY